MEVLNMADEHLSAVSRTTRDTPTPPERQMLKALGEIIVSLEAGLPQQALATAMQTLKTHAPLLNGIQNDGPSWEQTWPPVAYEDLSISDRAAHDQAMFNLAAIAARKP
jgi:hypothetical protein